MTNIRFSDATVSRGRVDAWYSGESQIEAGWSSKSVQRLSPVMTIWETVCSAPRVFSKVLGKSASFLSQFLSQNMGYPFQVAYLHSKRFDQMTMKRGMKNSEGLCTEEKRSHIIWGKIRAPLSFWVGLP
jgi:hypothetical protein